MMLPGNLLLFSIRTLLFHTGEQSSPLLVWGNSWLFSLTAKLKNQVEKKSLLGSYWNIIFLAKPKNVVLFSMKYFMQSQMKCFILCTCQKSKETKRRDSQTSHQAHHCSPYCSEILFCLWNALPPRRTKPQLHLKCSNVCYPVLQYWV